MDQISIVTNDVLLGRDGVGGGGEVGCRGGTKVVIWTDPSPYSSFKSPFKYFKSPFNVRLPNLELLERIHSRAIAPLIELIGIE